MESLRGDTHRSLRLMTEVLVEKLRICTGGEIENKRNDEGAGSHADCDLRSVRGL